MANIRIKDIPNTLNQMGENDIIPVEDVANNETKKIKIAGLRSSIGNAQTAADGLMSKEDKDKFDKISGFTNTDGSPKAIKNIESISSDPDYLGQLGVLNNKPYQAISLTNNVKWLPLKTASYPFKETAVGDVNRADLSILRNIILELYLEGTTDPAKTYSITQIMRNNAGYLGGAWYISVYSAGGTPEPIEEVCSFLTTDNPENGDGITVHELSERNGSGISGRIAVKWSAIPDGTYYDSMYAYNNMYPLDDSVWDKENAVILKTVENRNAISSLQTSHDELDSKAGKITDSGKFINAYSDNEIYIHPRGESEYAGNSSYDPNGVGLYEYFPDGVIFKKISVPLWAHKSFQTEVKIYSSLTPWNGVLSNLTLIESITYPAGVFNSVQGQYHDIILTNRVKLAAKTYLYVLCGNAGYIKTPTWTTAESNPARHPFFFIGESDYWSHNWFASSLPGYGAVPFKLYVDVLPAGLINGLKPATVSAAGEISGVSIAKTQWKHPRGDAEYVGNASYQLYGVGVYNRLTNDAVFDRVLVNMYGNTNATYEARIYKSTVFSSNPANLTLIESVSFPYGKFNQVSGQLAVIQLSDIYKAIKGEYIYCFVFQTSAGDGPIMQRWTEYAGSYPERQALMLTYSNPWGASWSMGSEPTYCGTPLKLELSTADNSALPSVETKVRVNPRITIPSHVYCAIGRELNIWYDALCVSYGGDILVNFSGSVGKTKQRGYRYNPSQTETNTIIITATDRNGNLLEKKIFTLHAVPNNNGSGTKQILFIGDSLTYAGYISDEFRTVLTAEGDVTPYLLGTQGSAPNRHEGHGGWTYNSFITAGSPFYINGQLDFKQYMANNSNFGGSDIIDFAMIQLGINDVYGGIATQAGVTNIINNAKTLINGILHATRGYPNCKVILAIPPISGNTKDGCANNQGASTDFEQFERNMRLLWENIVSTFDNGAYHANVYLAINGLMIDRYYGYTFATEAVSARCSTQIQVHDNHVHPAAIGYYQLADGYLSRFRSLL